ncbi:MAG: SDR family NAD(P)-dependent oxidoreductase [Okeania sp. SIO3I5]|nr:SDR family NAD(P)-dependent oxidoreductase [Okeania sp. SIO3I5]
MIPGVAQSSLWGMGKVISIEHPELNCVRIDLDPQQTIESQAEELFQEVGSKDKEDQVAWRGDERYVARLVASPHQQAVVEDQKVPSQPFKLGISQKGSLDNLILQPITRKSPAAREIEIRVRATGLNFRDILVGLGAYPGEGNMGGECAGEIVAVGEQVKDFQVGDSVIALTEGSFSQYITVDEFHVVLKPENLSFEEAASIPNNFLTAYYTLHHIAKITAGDRVLIHAATGGTGMAAVKIAQQAGAEVFATASPAKWDALRQMGVKHIMNSRTVEFADRVMEITEGQGVNIVLNSLTSGEFISKGLSVVSRTAGRFVEISKRGVWEPSRVAEFRPDISYFVADWSVESQEKPELINSMWKGLVDQFSKNLLQPLPLKLFPIEEVINAFRYMQQAKHIGKIVVTQTAQPANETKSLNFREDACYLITGGMGSLGLLVARWMVDKGAKHLVLLGRRVPDDITNQKITELEIAGASVVVEKADVSDIESMTRVVHKIDQSNIPLAGVMHLAGILSDGVLQNQNWSSFEQVMAPKVQGAWHLHQLTQNQPLDFFVLFSSIASLWGGPGQGNYSAANGFLDGLAHYRRTQGLPGLSIHWGVISEIGLAAERGLDITAPEQGMGVISPTQVLEFLELLMNGSDVEVGVFPIEWSKWQERVAQWSFLADWQETILEDTKSSRSDFLLKLEATLPSERRLLLVAHVRRQVANVLGINDSESIALEREFFDLGMDSLTSVELRNKLQSSLKCSVPSTLAFDYPTINQLVDYLTQQLNLTDAQEDRSNNLSAEKIDFNAEAILDPTIIPKTKVNKNIVEPQNIFLTGATGFVGAYLLDELLRKTSANIYCLIRANDTDLAKQKLKDKLKSYLLWDEDKFSSRIIPVVGDLSSQFFGLSTEEFNFLANQIDVIYHNGAWANHINHYAILKPTNVLGTQEVLRLASQIHVKPVHFISTVEILFSLSSNSDSITILESEPLGEAHNLKRGYGQSKWVADKLVMAANERGIPTCVYRLPMITADTNTGASNTNDRICRYIKGCMQLGMVPILESKFLENWVPVNEISQAIVYLSQQETSFGKAFHLINPETTSLNYVFSLICSVYSSVKEVSLNDWVMALSNYPKNALHSYIFGLSSQMEKSKEKLSSVFYEHMQLSVTSPQEAIIDDRNTQNGLLGSGITFSSIDKPYLEKMLSYLNQSGFLNLPS